jgi:Family of unknown function (DUF6232)
VPHHAAPLSWELSPAERTPGLGAVLRLGARAIPVSEIRGFIGSSDLEVDTKPAFATLAVFGVAALFFLLGVLDIGWRMRFLAASVLFGLIALSALHDMVWMTTSGLFRVEILTANGETLRYTTVDPAEQARLMTALDRAIAQPRAANDDSPADVMPPPQGNDRRWNKRARAISA